MFVKLGISLQIALALMTPVFIWASAAEGEVRAAPVLDVKPKNIIAALENANARILWVSPDGTSIGAIGPRLQMSSALLSLGVLPLPTGSASCSAKRSLQGQIS